MSCDEETENIFDKTAVPSTDTDEVKPTKDEKEEERLTLKPGKVLSVAHILYNVHCRVVLTGRTQVTLPLVINLADILCYCTFTFKSFFFVSESPDIFP